MDRIKSMLRKYQERTILERLEKYLQAGGEISSFLTPEPSEENQKYFDSLPENEKRSVLVLAGTDFISTLNKTLQREATELKRILIKEEKKENSEDDGSHESYYSEEHEPGDGDDGYDDYDNDNSDAEEEESSGVPGGDNPENEEEWEDEDEEPEEDEQEEEEWEDDGEDGEGEEEGDE